MVTVYKTEKILNEIEPSFKLLKMKMATFCKNDSKSLLRLSAKNFNPDEEEEDKLYGFCTTTLDLIISNNQKPFPLYSKNGKVKVGQLIFKQSRIVEQPSFNEYLKSGWHINMSVAIDYTASNGECT